MFQHLPVLPLLVIGLLRILEHYIYILQRMVLVKDKVPVTAEEINNGDTAVGGCPDDGGSVSSLEIRFHHFVVLPIGQDEAFQMEASDAHCVNGLLTLVGESKRIGVPGQFQTFKILAVAGDVVQQTVDVNLTHQSVGQTLDQSHLQNLDIFEGWHDIRTQRICALRDAREDETTKVLAEACQELVKTFFGQVVAQVQVESDQVLEVSTICPRLQHL